MMKITHICVHKNTETERYANKECTGETERGRYGEEGEGAEGAKIKRDREHTNKRGKILASKVRCEISQ